MKRLMIVALTAALTACGKTKIPPSPTSAAAVGVELATYPQVLVPLSAHPLGNAETAYQYGAATVSGSTVAAMIAYSSAWLLPDTSTARPMTPLQFLQAFASSEPCGLAVLITPKGSLLIGRSDLLDVLVAARDAGAATAELPFTAIRGSAR